MEKLKYDPVVEIGEEGSILIDRDRILAYLRSNPEMEHMSVRDFLATLAELEGMEAPTRGA